MRLLKLCAIAVALAVASGSSASVKYEVSYADSYLIAVTGKAGVFAFAGHQHAISASQWKAQLKFDPQVLARSSVSIVIPASALVADSPGARQRGHLGSGPSAADVKTIQARMLSPELLDASRYPTISFNTVSARETSPGTLLLTGDLTVHGRTERISVPIAYQRESTGAYILNGDFKIRQTDFGIKPETAGGGTVKVKDEVQIRFRVSLLPSA